MNSYFLPETYDSAAKTRPASAAFGIRPSGSAGHARLKQESPAQGAGQ